MFCCVGLAFLCKKLLCVEERSKMIFRQIWHLLCAVEALSNGRWTDLITWYQIMVTDLIAKQLIQNWDERTCHVTSQPIENTSGSISASRNLGFYVHMKDNIFEIHNYWTILAKIISKGNSIWELADKQLISSSCFSNTIFDVNIFN